MRGVWLSVLLAATGCRAVAETGSGSRAPKIAPLATPLPSERTATAPDSEIVQAAFSPEQADALPTDGGDASTVGPRWATSQDGGASQGEPVVPATSMSLTLEAAVRTALARNPDLTVVRSGGPVAQAMYQVAKTYPFNPQFQTQVLPFTRNRNGKDAPVSQQHVIVQTFELAGQRRFRTGAAAANWQQVRGTILAAELLSVAQTERLFFAALYQRDLRDIAKLLAEQNEELVGVTERRLKAGLALRADAALARLQAQSARRQQSLAEANYETALMALRNFLALEEDAEWELSGQWTGWQWQSVADVLRDVDYNSPDHQGPGASTDEEDAAFWLSVRSLVARRPDVAAARAAVAMARENLALADALRTPNLQIGPMWQRDDSSTQFWGVQGQMDIPVVNTGKPLVQQRWAELRQQQMTAARLEEKALLEARAAVRRYERARRLIEQSQAEFASNLPDAFQPFEEQFQAGQIDLLQVFAARAALTQSRQSFLGLLNELTLAAADVTQATGLPAQFLMTDRAPQPIPRDEVPTP